MPPTLLAGMVTQQLLVSIAEIRCLIFPKGFSLLFILKDPVHSRSFVLQLQGPEGKTLFPPAATRLHLDMP